MRRRMFLLGAVVAVAGCVGRATRSNPFDGGGTGSRSIRVEAVNRNFNQATLEALGPVQRRLGIVPGNGRRTFTLTWPAENELRIRIDLLAGDRATTNPISIKPGETAYLTVQNPVYRSLLRR